MDKILTDFLTKCEDSTVTVNDLNDLIVESLPSSIKDRVHRRTRITPYDSHIDHDGHQSMTLPNFKDRINPKKSAHNKQNHGRSRSAHDKSTRTQQIQAAADFIKENANKEITTTLVESAPELIHIVANRLIMRGIMVEWLSKFVEKLKENHE